MSTAKAPARTGREMTHAARLQQAQRHLAAADSVMAGLISRYGPCQLNRRKRPAFDVLVRAIINQQLSLKAAATIEARLRQALGATRHFQPQHLLHAEDALLRACGLSGAKARWLPALAARTLDGSLNFRQLRSMDDDSVRHTLIQQPGVGPWTAEMLLIFGLARMDVFAPGDVGLRRTIDQLYNRGRPLSEARTLKLAARWSPWRSVACWYLWREIDGDDGDWT